MDSWHGLFLMLLQLMFEEGDWRGGGFPPIGEGVRFFFSFFSFSEREEERERE